MKIDNVIEMLYKPMDGDEIIKMLDAFDLKIPELDDSYTVGSQVNSDKASVGLSFTFQELDEDNNNQGSPVLMRSTVFSDTTLSLPFDIKWSDSYEEVKKKIGFSPKYGDKYIKTMRIWLLKRTDERDYRVAIRFDKELSEILGFVILHFLPSHDETLPKLNEER